MNQSRQLKGLKYILRDTAPPELWMRPHVDAGKKLMSDATALLQVSARAKNKHRQKPGLQLEGGRDDVLLSGLATRRRLTQCCALGWRTEASRERG